MAEEIGLGASHDDTTIVRSVIAMAHSLGLAARPMPYESMHPAQSARLAASGAT